jgi:antitoxin CcdA
MNIAEWRKSLGVTQDQLAEAVGTSRPHLSKVERGATEPSPDLARRIEAYTRGKVTAASLLGLAEVKRGRRGVREDAEPFAGAEQLTIELSVSAEQSRLLQKHGVNIEAIARTGAEKALKEAEARAWADANREAIEASNRWIEKHGTLAEQLGLI